MMNLTKTEKMVLNAMRDNEVYDCYYDDYTFESAVVQNSGLEEKTVDEIISSLFEKDLVWFGEDFENESVVGLTEEGKKLFEEANGEKCNGCEPRLLKIEEDENFKEDKKMNLTKMEKMVLNATRTNEYNDCYEDDYTFAFAVIANSGLKERAAGGVISSLIKKGLVWFEKNEDEPDAIGLTDEGKALFDKADGEDCKKGGPKLLKIEETEDKKVQKTEDTEPKKVTMVAFTGMRIGEFEVIKETKKAITVMTKSGELSFNKSTGIQLNPRNEKFANRIQVQ